MILVPDGRCSHTAVVRANSVVSLRQGPGATDPGAGRNLQRPTPGHGGFYAYKADVKKAGYKIGE